MGADVSQLNALAADLAAAQTAMGQVRTAVQKSGYDLQREMQAQITGMDAVDTGAMLNSVTVSFAGNAEWARAEVGPTVDYAGYVHDGTYRMAGRPFADAAANLIEPNFVAAVEAIGGQLL